MRHLNCMILHEALKVADLMCLFTHYEMKTMTLEESLWNSIMSVILLILAEILKCMRAQTHRLNTTCMLYDCNAALCIFLHVFHSE